MDRVDLNILRISIVEWVSLRFGWMSKSWSRALGRDKRVIPAAEIELYTPSRALDIAQNSVQ